MRTKKRDNEAEGGDMSVIHISKLGAAETLTNLFNWTGKPCPKNGGEFLSPFPRIEVVSRDVARHKMDQSHHGSM